MDRGARRATVQLRDVTAVVIFQHFWASFLFSYFLQSESEVAQSCPTLCDPWSVAHQAPPSMGFSRQEYWSGLPLPPPRVDLQGGVNFCHTAQQFSYTCMKKKVKVLVVSDSLRPPWTQAPLSVAFSRQEYWSGLPFPSPGNLPDPGIEPASPALQVDSVLSKPPRQPSIVLCFFF